MKRPVRIFFLFTACGLIGAGAASTLAPAINWVAPLFTKDNFHSMTVRGARASFPSSDEVKVEQLNLTVYSGDAAKKIETVIVSPAATFLPRKNYASGETGVQVTRDDIEASGIHWTYDHAEKKVSLTGHVRIVFNAELKGILK
ncbi:MAG: LPS export ABC transporter periplasmic protein LptC [Opitutaceae bacterium]